MAVECERILKGRVFEKSDAAVADCRVEMVAGPVEDTLICLLELLMFRDDAKGRSVDGDKKVVLENVSMCGVYAFVTCDLSSCDQFIAIRCPCQRKRALADFDFANTRFRPYVPEPDHTVRGRAC